MKKLALLISTMAFILAAGCSSDKPDNTGSQPGAPAPAKPVAEGTADPGADIEVADSDLPVAPDFEDEADREITGDNYTESLSRLPTDPAAFERYIDRPPGLEAAALFSAGELTNLFGDLRTVDLEEIGNEPIGVARRIAVPDQAIRVVEEHAGRGVAVGGGRTPAAPQRGRAVGARPQHLSVEPLGVLRVGGTEYQHQPHGMTSLSRDERYPSFQPSKGDARRAAAPASSHA